MKPRLSVLLIILRSIGRCLMVCGRKVVLVFQNQRTGEKFLNLPMLQIMSKPLQLNADRTGKQEMKI